ncbi:MAG: PxxKW family cysteine-rich protein [Pseudomonadota bacterium]|uniref:Uncharacterized protein n=1 Tax=Candidatus Desulfatibia profunda TaxID=2841695 RepID=A0A8J6NQD7_9BACT|nr:hypothetical protein [Candidatus Desulfatibia profunda]MBL7179250.1 PxxKW family cysteine-rich protein [Desulfobacterales bacterium]
MDCTTVRKGFECPFMTAKGCSYNGGICHEIVEECNGCNRSVEFSSRWYCTSCPDPTLKWKTGNCNIASHVAKSPGVQQAKINPLKASKRANR